MIKIGDKRYYIDFGAIEKIIAGGDEFKAKDQKEIDVETYFEYDEESEKQIEFSKTITERNYRKDRQYDAAKYDILNMMIQVVMHGQDEDIDDMMGLEKGLEKQPLPFKIAFNTLLYYKVLKNLDL